MSLRRSVTRVKGNWMRIKKEGIRIKKNKEEKVNKMEMKRRITIILEMLTKMT